MNTATYLLLICRTTTASDKEAFFLSEVGDNLEIRNHIPDFLMVTVSDNAIVLTNDAHAKAPMSATD